MIGLDENERGGGRGARGVEVDEPPKVHVGVKVSVDDEHVVADLGAKIGHGSGCAARTLLDMIMELDTPARAVAEVGGNDLWAVAKAEMYLPPARRGQAFDEMFQDRFAAEGEHRLGQRLGGGPHPFSPAACDDHCGNHAFFA